MKKLSKEQEDYRKAIALMQTVREEYNKRFDELNLNTLYDQDFDKAFNLEEQLSKELHFQETYTIKAEAEKALVEWAFECVEFHMMFRARIEELETLRKRARENIYVREHVAKVAMNLDVEES